MADEIEKYNSDEETEGSQRFHLGRPLMIVSLPKKFTYLIYLSVILLLVLLTALTFCSTSQPASKESDFPVKVIMTDLMNSKDSSSEETTPDDLVFRSSPHSLLYSQICHQFIIRKVPKDETAKEKKTDTLSGAISNIFVAQAVTILALQFAHIFLYLYVGHILIY